MKLFKLFVNRADLFGFHLTLRLSSPLTSTVNVSFLFRVTMDSLAPLVPQGPLEKRSGCPPCTFPSENVLPVCHYCINLLPLACRSAGLCGNSGH